jgi:hypothetical protein
MSSLSLTWKNRPFGRAVGSRAHAEDVRDAAGPVSKQSRREGAVETDRVLAGTLAVYASLILLPLLATVPIVVTGLFLGLLTTLFRGVV